jgi:hypothetical protein
MGSVSALSVATQAVADQRSEPRTNMFVMATIASGSGSGPVKVRNLSPGGALVEGGILPTPGTRIILNRADLSMHGKVVWSASGRAGLRFESLADVAQWLPAGVNSHGQQRVDQLVQQIKASPRPAYPPQAPAIMIPAAISFDDLRQVKKALESLAEDLACDPDVIARHCSRLQALDLAAQLLDKLLAG